MQRYERFEGTIGRTLAESTPWWAEPPRAGADAPNVVVILIDDLGFSHFGCYGSDIDTPNIDRLASGGLQYTNFHVTPLCSPTRASLLTGRNHHSVGMRGVSNWNTGFPHMTGHISPHAATAAEVLRDEGYATFAVGKWHLCEMEQACAAGPYQNWPCQRGFDRFYGFLDGETDQFHPELVADNHFIDPPRTVGLRLPPERGPRGPVDPADLGHEVHPAGQAVLPLPRVRRHARAPPGAGRVPREVPREVRRRLGRHARALVREAEGARARPARHRPRAAQPRRRRLGRPAREPPQARGTPAGGLRRLPRPHRRADRSTGRLPRRPRRARQHDGRAALGQRRFAGGRPLRRAARVEVLQLRHRDARRGRGAPRRHRRPAQPQQLPVGLGPGREHAVQVVQAEHPRRRGARAVHRALARAARDHDRAAPPVPPRERRRADDLRGARRHAARGVPRVRADAGDRHVDGVELRRRAARRRARSRCSTSRWSAIGASGPTAGRP